MVEIKLNKSNDNPFYGMRNCLRLMQGASSAISIQALDQAYSECKTKEQREMFFSLIFSIGDITARQHNIFKGKKKDSGGNANRAGFETIIQWLWHDHRDQFIKFLNAELFNEFTCFDLLLKNRVQTKGTKVINIYNMFENPQYRATLADYFYKVINGTNEFNKLLIAKFLSLPRITKRAGHKKLLPQTKKLMEDKVKFLSLLSELMGWEYEVSPTIANFKGYREWRKKYNQDLESVVFSTGAIKNMNKQQFLDWFDKLPAQARFRAKNRILYAKGKDDVLKYPAELRDWVTEWTNFKEQKQAEQRVLEEKVRQGQASEEDKVKLEKVKKEAKVTVGATNFKELYADICAGRVDKLKVESFINKVNLPYNSLVIIDDSGSMQGAPFNFASFLAAVCLAKNPDDDGRNLLGFFNNSTHWHSFIDRQERNSFNSILRSEVATTKATPFIDPTLSFHDNYQRIAKFCHAVFRGGGTNISSIPDGLKYFCDRDPQILDALKAYPVWTIISDGEWNNLRSPEASLNDFFRKCEQYFGYRPFIVAIDVAGGAYWNSFDPSRVDAERFSGIDNFMYIPANPAQIEQFLTNFKDMDVFDAYTTLQSLYRSNRYELVRANTL